MKSEVAEAVRRNSFLNKKIELILRFFRSFCKSIYSTEELASIADSCGNSIMSSWMIVGSVIKVKALVLAVPVAVVDIRKIGKMVLAAVKRCYSNLKQKKKTRRKLSDQRIVQSTSNWLLFYPIKFPNKDLGFRSVVLQ